MFRLPEEICGKNKGIRRLISNDQNLRWALPEDRSLQLRIAAV